MSSKTNKDILVEINACKKKIVEFKKNKESTRVIEWYQKAISICQSSKLDAELCNLYFEYAHYRFELGSVFEYIKLYKKSLEYAQTEDQAVKKFDNLLQFVFCLTNLGSLDEALEKLVFLEENYQESFENDKYRHSRLMLLRSEILRELKQYDECIDQLKVIKRVNSDLYGVNPEFTALFNLSLGQVYLSRCDKGDLDKCIKLSMATIKKGELDVYGGYLISNYLLCGFALNRKKKFPGAISIMEQGLLRADGLKYDQDFGHEIKKILLLIGLTTAYFELDDLKKAKKIALRAARKILESHIHSPLNEYANFHGLLAKLNLFEWAYKVGLHLNKAQEKSSKEKQELLTIELKEKYLSQLKEQENKQLRALGKAKDTFFTQITHELKTPLSLMTAPAEQILEQEKLTASGKQNVGYIINNSRRMQNLIDRILFLNRLQENALQLYFVLGNVIEAIQSLAKAFNSIANKKSITFRTVYENTAIFSYFEPYLLERIIQNLLSNAFKFTPSNGRVNLHVGRERDHLFVNIANTGSRIPNSLKGKIFEPYVQEKILGKEQVFGSGIGLAIVYESLKKINGQVTVDCKRENVTEFTTLIPIIRSAPNKGETLKDIPRFSNIPDEVETIQGGTKVKKGKRKVLLVEDNDELRSFLAEYLNQAFNIEIALNGQEGIDKALNMIPDVIITDIVMPNKNGYELCNTLKNKKETSHIPIIMLTAKGTSKEQMEGYQSNADAYITKPFSPKLLLSNLESLLANRDRIDAKHAALISLEDVGIKVESMEDQFMKDIIDLLKKEMKNNQLSATFIANRMGMSRISVNRKLKTLVNKSIKQLVKEVRLITAKKLILNNTHSLKEVAYEVGYSSPEHFSKSFKSHFGLSPRMMKKNNGLKTTGLS